MLKIMSGVANAKKAPNVVSTTNPGTRGKGLLERAHGVDQKRPITYHRQTTIGEDGKAKFTLKRLEKSDNPFVQFQITRTGYQSQHEDLSVGKKVAENQFKGMPYDKATFEATREAMQNPESEAARKLAEIREKMGAALHAVPQKEKDELLAELKKYKNATSEAKSIFEEALRTGEVPKTADAMYIMAAVELSQRMMSKVKSPVLDERFPYRDRCLENTRNDTHPVKEGGVFSDDDKAAQAITRYGLPLQSGFSGSTCDIINASANFGVDTSDWKTMGKLVQLRMVEPKMIQQISSSIENQHKLPNETVTETERQTHSIPEIDYAAALQTKTNELGRKLEPTERGEIEHDVLWQ
jgi:hypothetical protein